MGPLWADQGGAVAGVGQLVRLVEVAGPTGHARHLRMCVRESVCIMM